MCNCDGFYTQGLDASPFQQIQNLAVLLDALSKNPHGLCLAVGNPLLEAVLSEVVDRGLIRDKTAWPFALVRHLPAEERFSRAFERAIRVHPGFIAHLHPLSTTESWFHALLYLAIRADPHAIGSWARNPTVDHGTAGAVVLKNAAVFQDPFALQYFSQEERTPLVDHARASHLARSRVDVEWFSRLSAFERDEVGVEAWNKVRLARRRLEEASQTIRSLGRH